MPELPEVEILCRGLFPYLVGETIVATVVRQPKLRWPVADELYQLAGARIITLQRRAKYLLMQFANGWLIIHLGMSGCLRLLAADTPINRHDHIDIALSSGKIVRFTDPRRFGCWLWSDDLQQHRLLMKLGAEPLSSAFNGGYLAQAVRGQTMAIKPWLMKNDRVVGIGNIYASEALHRARISPCRPAGLLSQDQAEQLVKSIKQLLRAAIRQGGSTLRDFSGADGTPGYFTQQLQVYGRRGEPCRHCTTPIALLKQGQRSTFYCPNCQL